MDKPKEYLTVMILTSSLSLPKTFRIKKKALKVFLGTVCFLSVISICIFTQFFYLLDEREDITRLKKNNEVQKMQLKAFSSILDDLKEQMKMIDDYEKKVRIITGLKNEDIPDTKKLEKNIWVGSEAEENGRGGEDEVVETDETEFSGDYEKDTNIHIDMIKLKEEIDRKKQSLEDMLIALVDRKRTLDATPSIWPTEGYLSSVFGRRFSPFTGKLARHNGVDIANKMGTSVVATGDGIVIKAGKDGLLGNMVRIRHTNNIETLYAHLESINVQKGQRVKRGQNIGGMGDTGRSTGPHLHYSVYKNNVAQNPLKYILE